MKEEQWKLSNTLAYNSENEPNRHIIGQERNLGRV